jgi:hypothetical protein
MMGPLRRAAATRVAARQREGEWFWRRVSHREEGGTRGWWRWRGERVREGCALAVDPHTKVEVEKEKEKAVEEKAKAKEKEKEKEEEKEEQGEEDQVGFGSGRTGPAGRQEAPRTSRPNITSPAASPESMLVTPG